MRSYGDEIKQIAETIDTLFASELDERKSRMQSRALSVSLRKLLLDNNNLIKRAIHAPTFHKLAYPLNTEAIELTYAIVMKNKDGTEHSHEISTLPGFDLTTDLLWIPHHNIFDLSAEPKLKNDNWLRQPLIKITHPTHEKPLTLRDVMQHVADTEGAHVDNNPKPKKSKKSQDPTYIS